jgi:CheY-like chemotaxis protein
MLAVCPEAADCGVLRRGAAQASVPLDFVETDAAGKAVAMLEGGDLDLVLLDSALPPDERARITKAARERAAFVILLVGADGAQGADATHGDTMAPKPGDVTAAKTLIDRCVRSRLPCRVLVVDDSPTMRGIVRKILSATRFPLEIAEAGEGESAVQQVRQGEFDVVFLDYNMPGLDGVATLTELKGSKPELEVVIMTSAQEAAVAERAHRAGATAFLKKPFFPADIDAVLHGLYGFIPLKPAG